MNCSSLFFLFLVFSFQKLVSQLQNQAWSDYIFVRGDSKMWEDRHLPHFYLHKITQKQVKLSVNISSFKWYQFLIRSYKIEKFSKKFYCRIPICYDPLSTDENHPQCMRTIRTIPFLLIHYTRNTNFGIRWPETASYAIHRDLSAIVSSENVG